MKRLLVCFAALLGAMSIHAQPWQRNFVTTNTALTINFNDAGAHRIWGWDNTDNQAKGFVIGSGLSYDAATDTLSSTGGSQTPIIQNVNIAGFTMRGADLFEGKTLFLTNAGPFSANYNADRFSIALGNNFVIGVAESTNAYFVASSTNTAYFVATNPATGNFSKMSDTGITTPAFTVNGDLYANNLIVTNPPSINGVNITNIAGTNVVYAFKAPFSTNYTALPTDTILACTGTNQVITFSATGATAGQTMYTVLISSTTGFGSVICTNDNGSRTILTAAALSQMLTNGQSITAIWDGANWR